MRLLKSVAFATAIALAGLTIPVAARAEHTGDDIQPEVVSGFQACHNSHDMKPAKETSLGSELGEGISEVVTEELREMVNQGCPVPARMPCPKRLLHCAISLMAGFWLLTLLEIKQQK